MPADVEACNREPVADPRGGVKRPLTAGEIERLWKTDQRSLALVSGCFYRIVCQYHAVRKEIGQVENEPVCVPTEEELRKEVPNIRKGRPHPIIPAPPIPKHQKRQE